MIPKATPKQMLSKIYDNARFPVIFVTQEIKIMYCNDMAREKYPELCEKDGIKSFLSQIAIEDAKSKLKAGEPVHISQFGIRGFESVSFLPLGGCLEGKCAIMHVEENKDFLNSMYAEVADLDMADRSSAVMDDPVQKMRILIDKLAGNDAIMSDTSVKATVLSMTECLQEFVSYVRDYAYAIKIVSRASTPRYTTFKLYDFFNTFCKMHEGLNFAEPCPPEKLVVCDRVDLDTLADTVVHYIFASAPARKINIHVRTVGDYITLIFRAKRVAGEPEKFNPEGKGENRLNIVRQIAAKYEGDVSIEDKKGMLSIIVRIKSALGDEPGSYLHNNREPLI